MYPRPSVPGHWHRSAGGESWRTYCGRREIGLVYRRSDGHGAVLWGTDGSLYHLRRVRGAECWETADAAALAQAERTLRDAGWVLASEKETTV